MRLDRMRLDRMRLDRMRLDRMRLDRMRLDRMRLDRERLGDERRDLRHLCGHSLAPDPAALRFSPRPAEKRGDQRAGYEQPLAALLEAEKPWIEILTHGFAWGEHDDRCRIAPLWP